MDYYGTVIKEHPSSVGLTLGVALLYTAKSEAVFRLVAQCDR